MRGKTDHFLFNSSTFLFNIQLFHISREEDRSASLTLYANTLNQSSLSFLCAQALDVFVPSVSFFFCVNIFKCLVKTPSICKPFQLCTWKSLPAPPSLTPKMKHGNCSELSVLRAFLEGTHPKEKVDHLGTKWSNHLHTRLLTSRILCICVNFDQPCGLDTTFCYKALGDCTINTEQIRVVEGQKWMDRRLFFFHGLIAVPGCLSSHWELSGKH